MTRAAHKVKKTFKPKQVAMFVLSPTIYGNSLRGIVKYIIINSSVRMLKPLSVCLMF